MSTSIESTQNANNSTTIDNEKEKEDKNRFIDNTISLINTKESKFNELIQWLQHWGFKVIDRTKENKIVDIQFKAEISPVVPYSTGASTPFYLEFQNGLDDGFIIRSTFELDKNIELYLNDRIRGRELELAYIEIEQIILPMKISVIRVHPIINIYKIIFSENLTKQFFYDCINELINAMSLIIGKWDEKYYKINSKTPKHESDKLIG
jgi:hypothetical protein